MTLLMRGCSDDIITVGSLRDIDFPRFQDFRDTASTRIGRGTVSTPQDIHCACVYATRVYRGDTRNTLMPPSQ